MVSWSRIRVLTDNVEKPVCVSILYINYVLALLRPCQMIDWGLIPSLSLLYLRLPFKLNIEMYYSWFTQEVFPQLNIIVLLEAISK